MNRIEEIAHQKELERIKRDKLMLLKKETEKKLDVLSKMCNQKQDQQNYLKSKRDYFLRSFLKLRQFESQSITS